MKVNIRFYTILSLMGFSVLSFLLLSSSVLADSAVTTTTINIAESCTMSGTTNTAHSATILNGTYSGTDYTNGIGQTTLKVFCNDSNGFAIYAIGYTNDEYGNNKLHWSGATSTSDITNDINTGIYSSGATTSSWSMKLAAMSGTYAATIDDGVSANNNSTDNFTNWHIVPTEYKRVAYRTSGTDLNTNNNGTGSSITTTYDAYVSATQPAGTYTGQVKYTLVHPNKSDQSNKPMSPISASVAPDNAIIFAPNTSDTEGDMSSLPYTQDSSAAALRTASPRAGAISATANSTATLIAPNFKREGYGFAGWSKDFEATSSSTIYGPNETISTNPQDARGLDVSGGAVLYPVWIAKETGITMQTFNSTTYTNYTSAPNGTVIALEDERDHDVYAVAKLADGNWWMIENLRLDDSATLTTTNTHNPLHDTGNNDIVTLKTDYANGTIEDHLAASNSGTWCNSYNAACDDQTMLNTNNTRLSDSSLTPSHNGSNATSKWHSYGNYYNWYSATAGNGTYSKSSGNVDGDLCPASWHLPYGNNGTGTGGGNTTGGFYYLNTQMSNNTSTQGSKDWRTYPNNFVFSGYWNGAYADDRDVSGRYWSSSAISINGAYYLYLSRNSIIPGTYDYSKFYGYSVRCVAGS